MRLSLIRNFKLALCGATALMLVACASSEERAKAYTESGNKYLEQQDYDKAAIEFRNALKLKDDYADAWFGMAQVEEHQKSWQHLIGDLNKVIEINPGHVKARQALASFFLAAGDYPGALKEVNKALEIEPKNPDLILLRAAVLLKSGDRVAARAEIGRAIVLEPNRADAAILLGQASLEAGQTAEALAIANKGLLANPKSLELHLFKIRLLEMSNDVPGLEAELRELIAQYPEKKIYKTTFVTFLVQNKRMDEAEALLRQLHADNPDDLEIFDQLSSFFREVRGTDVARAELIKSVAANPASFIDARRLAQMEFEAGNTGAAISRLTALIASTPREEDKMSARMDLAADYIGIGKLPEAKALIDQVLLGEPDNITGLKARAVLMVEDGAYDEAILVLRSAANLNSKDADLRLLLANTYERKGSLELANAEFKTAWELGHDVRTGTEYARYMVRRTDLVRADDLLTELAASQPNSIMVLDLLAQVRLQRGNWSGALEVATALETRTKNSTQSNAIRAAALAGDGKTAEAVVYLEKNATANPDDPAALASLVQAYIQTRRYGDAETYVRAILARHPDNPVALASLGAIRLEQGNKAEAETSFKAAITHAPDLPIGYLALADFYTSQNKPDDAIQVLTIGVEKIKDNVDLRMTLASLYLTIEKSSEALKQYESIMALDSDIPLAVNNYASIIADNSDTPAELKKAAQAAVALRDSPMPQFRETYGWILVRTGQVKSGLQILERSIDELHDMAVAQYHLGSAYLAAGDMKLADKHLKLALTLEKDAKQRLKIEQALKNISPSTHK